MASDERPREYDRKRRSYGTVYAWSRGPTTRNKPVGVQRSLDAGRCPNGCGALAGDRCKRCGFAFERIRDDPALQFQTFREVARSVRAERKREPREPWRRR